MSETEPSPTGTFEQNRNGSPQALPYPPADHDGTTRLLLICHAQSMHHRYGGLLLEDSGLTADGWEQSTALAQWLHDHEKIDHLISGSQLRCRLTAQRIGQIMGLTVSVDRGLPAAGEGNWTLQPPSAEEEELRRFATYEEDLLAAIQRLLENRWDKTVALVLSAPAIATILRHFLGCQQLGVQVNEATISELTLSENRWSLCYSNRQEHLVRQPLSQASSTAEPSEDAHTLEELRQARRVYNQVAAAHAGDELRRRTDSAELPLADLIQFAGFEPDRRLLDVGSGSGQLALELARSGAREVVGVDVSPAMLERAEYFRLSAEEHDLVHRVNYRLAPAHNLPFSSDRFDGAICRLLLHHVSKPDGVLDELARVIKPGGLLVLADFAGSEDPVKRATQNAIESKRNPSHASIRTVKQQKDLLEKAGFVIEKEKIVEVTRRASDWALGLALDPATQEAVVEMLEASIETDAADLHVRRQENDLVFQHTIVYLRARNAKASNG